MSNPLDCTVIVPLKDNHKRTLFTLKNSIFPELFYIFADGSSSDCNEVIFSKIHLANVQYVRFPVDESQTIFSEKMSNAAKLSTTKYTCTLDQGDIISLSGIKTSIQKLEENLAASAVCGRLYAARRVGRILSGIHRVNRSDHLSGVSSVEAISRIKNNYGLLWYSVMRTKDFCEIHYNLSKYEITHPEREIFPTIFLLWRGTYFTHQTPQALRIIYSPFKWTTQDSAFYDPKEFTDMKNKAIYFGDLCSRIIGTNSRLIEEIVEPLFLTVLRQRQRQWLGPKPLARLMPSNETVSKFPFLGSLEVNLEYILKMIFPSKPEKIWFSSMKLLRLKKWEQNASKTDE